MGSGIISLVANGAQDVYLTGNPQITFFKVAYRRYTNFAMEAIELNPNSNNPTKLSIEILRQGDLATKTALKVKLPAVKSDVLGHHTEKIAWVRRLGHAMIKEVKVEIGGMEIDKQLGVWLDILWELTHTVASERGYRELIGDVPELTTLRGRELNNGSNETLLPEFTLYIPFQFWFNRHYGLALPLIALQYHQVRIEVDLEDVSNLMVWTGCAPPSLNNFNYREVVLLVDYVYLEARERRMYAQLGHEYLIEQVQDQQESVTFNCHSSSAKESFRLDFNHPTKELIWALRVGAFRGESCKGSYGSSRGKFLTYTNEDDKWMTDALDYAAKNLAEGCIFVNPEGLNGEHGTINGQPVHLCSKQDNPGYNDGQRVTVELRNVCVDACRLQENSIDELNEENIRVYAYDTFPAKLDLALLGTECVELSDAIRWAHVVVSHCDGECESIQVEAVDVHHDLNLTDVSIPVDAFAHDNRSKDSQKFTVHKDVAVVQLNYGLRLDGRGNPVLCAILKLNGHDRFSVQEGSYFNYYQPYNHHTRTPADGINVYSFALFPEKHQPSGTTNLSRIDSTILEIHFGDRLRCHRKLKLDLARNSTLYIFALNYNVLRVMSGMGGLAYSN